MAQHHFDCLEVREEDLGHNALFPPHPPSISNRKWLPWSKELNSAVILQDCRIITLTSSEPFSFAVTSVKDRRGFLVSHNPWSTCSSNPSTFTWEGLLIPPIIESPGKDHPGWHRTSNGASLWSDETEFLLLSTLIHSQKTFLLCSVGQEWPTVPSQIVNGCLQFFMWSTVMQYILLAGCNPPSLFIVLYY